MVAMLAQKLWFLPQAFLLVKF